MARLIVLVACIAMCLIMTEGRPETRGLMDTTCNNSWKNVMSAGAVTLKFVPAGCFLSKYNACRNYWQTFYSATPPKPVPAPGFVAPECNTGFFGRK